MKALSGSSATIIATASVLAGILAIAAPASAAGASGSLVAHKAFYEMEMGDKAQNSHIVRSLMNASVSTKPHFPHACV